mgnify:CR=1 FL=1
MIEIALERKRKKDGKKEKNMRNMIEIMMENKVKTEWV